MFFPKLIEFWVIKFLQRLEAKEPLTVISANECRFQDTALSVNRDFTFSSLVS